MATVISRGRELYGKLKREAAEYILSQALMLLGHSSEKNYRLLGKAFDHIAKTEQQKMIARWLQFWLAEGNPGALWLHRVLHGLHPNVRRNFIASAIVNIFFRDPQAFARYKDCWGVRPPSIMLVSPTMRCNYRCDGCYAANYTRDDDLPPEVFHRILEEAKEMAIKFFIILGGEPFVYKPLLETFRSHRDVPFQVYSNGAALDPKLASTVAELGNVAPQISLEGFEKETDARRGKGAFERCMQAMDNLREAGCIFGFSCMVSRDNVDAVTSQEFIDLMVEKGALYGWYFLYMPVGGEADLQYMPTPQQRDQLRRAVVEFRRTKPILLADFWGDAPLTGGCLSGARTYFHVNHHGDVEPCIFFHFATDNVKETPLAEAINSPFFRSLRKMQPFCHNTLRPCPIIDQPKIMRTVVRAHGAYPTHEGAENILEPDVARALDEYAAEVEELYTPLWEEEYVEWASKWMTLMDYPEGRVEARRRGYLCGLNRRRVEVPLSK